MEYTFIFPKACDYAFDPICTQIVQALASRNFSVPGMEIKLDHYYAYAMVKKIGIPALDTYLTFCREQGSLDRDRNDCAAVSDLLIPRKILSVYGDFSGPTLLTYVGENWDREKREFFEGWHVNSRLEKEPRTYLRYSGSNTPKGRSSYVGIVNRYLAHNNDLGREYSPVGDEPTYYLTSDIEQEFATHLRDVVLPFIDQGKNT